MLGFGAKSYDVFISYRRESGEPVAHLLYDRLKTRKFRAFLDVTHFHNPGPFNTELLKVIENTPAFIAILTPHSLDNCAEDKGWFRSEIAYALRNKKNVIPIIVRPFKFSTDLPDDIRDVRDQNGLTFDGEYLDSFFGKLSKMITTPAKASWRNRLI